MIDRAGFGVSRRRFVVGCAAVMGQVGLSGAGLAQSGAAARVKTPNGVLRGETVRGVQVFRGVPFAEAPVGELRFRPPVKAKRWTGERDAVRFAAAAMQAGTEKMVTSEDCLYLNVWTPEVRPAKGLPVLVWIHGGGYTGGNSFSASTDGAVFARDGVVCVTIAYRLGVFGFLEVEPLLGASYAGSANNGLRDVMMALEWVQDNIAAFGGDPGRVTVGGQSAGAKMTDTLLGVPGARGLFGRAISESGGAERINTKAAAAAVGESFGAAWGKRSVTAASAKELVEAQVTFVAAAKEHFPLRPVVDGIEVPRLPLETIAGGATKGKALLIGTCREESASFLGPHPAKDPTAADLGNMRYQEVYPELTVEQRRIRAVTAEEYWVPSIRVADAHVRAGGRAWMYEVTLKDPVGRLKGYARHTLEAGLVWGLPEDASEDALSAELHEAWVKFIQGEDPAAAGLPRWANYGAGERQTMMIDVTCRVERRPQEAELKLWDGFLE
jgi:para-nitrobenzyl esterase